MNDTHAVPSLPLWTPNPEQAAHSRMAHFLDRMKARWQCELTDYDSLWQWSVDQPEAFWQSIWEEEGVIGEQGQTVLAQGDRMPGARWFPQARLNFAENLLRHRGSGTALVFMGEDGVRRVVSHDDLHAAVAAFAAALKAEGVTAGDRVAAFMPNIPEAIVAMLATASLGAIFTSASPDFGIQGVLDRFGQVEPKVLVTVDGYRYNGKALSILDKVATVSAGLPSLGKTVVVGFLDSAPDLAGISGAISTADFVAPHAATTTIDFVRLPFDHPLYILYSSGTTGVPKCIIHGAGGTLLQHLKEHRLHCDIHPGDRLFYFTTLGWMMFNWLASGLAAGATLLLYDGSPFARDGRILYDFIAAEGCTHFGVGAKFIDSCLKAELKPRQTHDLSALRVVLSTGSPLSPEGFDYVYQQISSDVLLASISGGTDIVSCFVLGNPLLPVWKGEIQCRGLGMAVEVLDDAGYPLRGEKGELACLKPFPSMPVGFWNDPGQKKYLAAYFEKIPGIWCHGDFAEFTVHGGLVIHGRSDATLNPGGVRIGTAEIYRQVEKLPEIVESLAIGQDWDDDTRVVLFVRLKEGMVLDGALSDRIRRQIRDNATPRHVPARIVQVSDIPRTKSGKIVELAVREVVHGRPVKNIEALANPEALALFRDIPALSR
ncbi:MAG: acetoacetate--CoA ligase [Proteobacteria bacterium]|nr:acetoacetate--CoA ligase [Pseudomonadota bacterium]HQR04621.1 acetoacetate--CoA ligase [Rhodocyclaceae bacterium]